MFGCTFNVNHQSIFNFRLSFSESKPVHQDKMHGRFLVTCLLIMTSNAWCSAIRRHLSHRSRNYASGEARYYEVATGAQTACGGYHTSSQAICAAGASVFGQGHRCGKYLVVYYGSKHVICILDDKCPSCAGDSLDLSPAVFKALAPLSQGVLQVHWQFV
ncbi:hypothetical protein PGT21_018652 [Puccinia graminis f. sp. tritici]|uniref:RlpA-like protein double-psi beta-barrel domain-containing protein n=1 Tax=Puccinia graminis f. sp. tritici TaxID=56615 RepID=A0A5B0M6G3_PUCGR|nr:hypothetical protein PGT21_018652 [Puccinia graminis f. sp. tritici]KAA1125896.1 hypothetical protein PGTUg99_017235 [Puccinia graminis f. sp. tritici]